MLIGRLVDLAASTRLLDITNAGLMSWRELSSFGLPERQIAENVDHPGGARQNDLWGVAMDTIFLLVGALITVLALNHGEAQARRAVLRGE